MWKGSGWYWINKQIEPVRIHPQQIEPVRIHPQQIQPVRIHPQQIQPVCIHPHYDCSAFKWHCDFLDKNHLYNSVCRLWIKRTHTILTMVLLFIQKEKKSCNEHKSITKLSPKQITRFRYVLVCFFKHYIYSKFRDWHMFQTRHFLIFYWCVNCWYCNFSTTKWIYKTLSEHNFHFTNP